MATQVSIDATMAVHTTDEARDSTRPGASGSRSRSSRSSS
jgi:hypothetical protein